MKLSLPFFLCAFLFISSYSYAQETADVSGWDNVMYAANKIATGSEKWRHSVEFQSRFNNDFGALEQWQVEYMASYLIKKRWEIVPDFRYTKKPSRNEFRPGLGVIFKNLFSQSQIVHQFKYQYDIRTGGVNNSHGLRYALYYNKKVAEKVLLTTFAGGLFEFGEDFNGFLGMRAGISAAYLFNEAHSFNLGYYYGLINDKTNNYGNIGIISLQLIINIRKDYKYMPAKIITL